MKSLMLGLLAVVLLSGCAIQNSVNIPDPELERMAGQANEAIRRNGEIAQRLLNSYATVQIERAKAGEITWDMVRALVDLKSAEVDAAYAAAVREIRRKMDAAIQRKSYAGRSFTCTTSTSSNFAFTTCD